MFNRLRTLIHSSYSFEGKKHYEHVLTLLYRHWFTILAKILVLLFMAIIPMAILLFGGGYADRFGLRPLLSLLGWVYAMIWWYALFKALTMYVLDTWVVTDHRIIDSRQKGFFRRDVAEMNLGKIQDISVSIKGIIPTFLDFGDVDIQTAGEQQKFRFHQIPHPNRVKDIIMHAHNEYVAQHTDGREVHES